MPKGVRRTHDDFLNELNSKKILESYEILGIYEKMTTPILCRCKRCNNVWKPTPKQLLRGGGCPKCASNHTLSKDEFLSRLLQKNAHGEEIEVLEYQSGLSAYLLCKCKKCGTEWHPRAGDLLYKSSGCPSCAGRFGYTHQQFLEKFKEKNSNFDSIQILSEYSGMLSTVHCRCKLCGTEWKPIASSLIQGTGCPACAKRILAEKNIRYLLEYQKENGSPTKMSNTEFLKKFEEKNPYAGTITILSAYLSANDYVECECKTCGKKWAPTASMLLQGHGCPTCSHSSTSFMEQFLVRGLIRIIDESLIQQRTRKIIGKELDIFLPDYSLAIEIGSWNWHKKTFQRDIEKQKACSEKNIRLITIYDHCDQDFSQYCDFLSFSKDLGTEREHTTLKYLLNMIKDILGINYSFSNNDWESIEKEAYLHSQKVSHEDFLKKFTENNKNASNIEILSKYSRATDAIDCVCRVCGHKWKTAASELIRGSGCSRCQMKQVGKTRQKREIIKAWREQHPTGTKLSCEKETGISRMTVYKWWNS